MAHMDPEEYPIDPDADLEFEESAADELPSDFDEPEEGRSEDDDRQIHNLPGESLYNRGVYLVLHRPGRYYNRMPSAARSIAEAAPDLNLIISQALPRVGTVKAAEYFDSFPGSTSIWRIADPEGYALPGDLIGEPALTMPQRTKVGYIGEAPAAGDRAPEGWNHRVVNTQRAAGANVLLTPGRTLDPGNPDTALASSAEELSDLLANIASEEYPAWNVTVDSVWLTDDRLRNQLLAELVDHEEISTWYIRVRWPLIRRTYGQTLSRAVLAGYQELAGVAAREAKVLLLPNTGMTGWLTLGWGSSGFGAGSTSSTQAWADTPKIASRPGVTRSTVQRIFSGPLLHTITTRSHQALEHGLSPEVYPRCDCQFCLEQATSDVWRPELAAQHAVYRYGMLTASVTRSGDRRAAVSETARTAWMRLHSMPAGLELEASETPEHLDAWADALGWAT